VKRAIREKAVASIILLAAIVLVAAGSVRVQKVYDPQTEAFGLAAFMRIHDRDLVADATFTGVERRDGKLYSTYDRSRPHGKRSCPA
jgi:hypothetical protein